MSRMLLGQSEKNVRALFLLATKLATTIIFIVDFDGILDDDLDNTGTPHEWGLKLNSCPFEIVSV